MNTKEDIINHFNANNRVEHDYENYGIKEAQVGGFGIDPFEQHRQDYILSQITLNHTKGSRILDVGCGIGNFIIQSLNLGFDAYGIDIASNMIQAAKKSLDLACEQSSRVTLVDILEYSPGELFDAIILNGVIWYYEDKQSFLNRVYSLLKPGGKAYIVHRNELFNIFALNQGTIDFFFKNLLSNIPEIEQNNVRIQIQEELSGMQAPIKNNGTLPKPYDNPLTIQTLYKLSGFSEIDIFYTYIHPAPPRFGLKFPSSVYRDSQNNYGNRWEGMFLGSQFIVVANKQC